MLFQWRNYQCSECVFQGTRVRATRGPVTRQKNRFANIFMKIDFFVIF